MATWKRLTSSDGAEIDVNLEQVAYMRRHDNLTNLYFVGATSDSPMLLVVKETPDRIHMMEALRSLMYDFRQSSP